MTVTVFHWPYALNMNGISVGHVALEVGQGSQYRYLSWYPRDAKSAASLIAAAPINHSRELDESAKGKASDQIVLTNLDEAAVIAHIDTTRSHYSLFGTSCAQTVADALRAGGGARLAPGPTSLNPIWTPLTAADFARRIRDARP